MAPEPAPEHLTQAHLCSDAARFVFIRPCRLDTPTHIVSLKPLAVAASLGLSLSKVYALAKSGALRNSGIERNFSMPP